jgi:hypothetical protein
MEDHFIERFVDTPQELMNPLVPLFVNWVEVKFGRIGCDLAHLQRLMRKDVMYFTVKSGPMSDILDKFTVIIADASGTQKGHLILPALFTFQPPGFAQSGKPLWDLESAVQLPPKYKRRSGITGNPSWSFQNYESYQCFPKMTINSVSKPTPTRLGFVGKADNTKIRQRLVEALQRDYQGKFASNEFPPTAVCKDSSVPKWGASACWRVYMLAADVALCPVGASPFSYRLYEALQMGVIPMHIYGKRKRLSRSLPLQL